MQNSTTANSPEMMKNEKELVVFDRSRFLMTPIWENLFRTFTDEKGYTMRYVTQDPDKIYEQSMCEEMAKDDPPVLIKLHGDVLRKFDFVQDEFESLDDTQAAQNVSAASFKVTSHDGRTVGLTYYSETIGFMYNRPVIAKYFALEQRQKEINAIEDINTQEKMELFVKDLDAHKAEIGVEAVFPTYCFAPGSEGMSYPMTPPLYWEAKDKGVTRLNQFDFTYQAYLKRFFDMLFKYTVSPAETFEKTDLLTHIGQFVTGKTAMMFGADAIKEVFVRRVERTNPEQVKNLVLDNDIGLIPPYYLEPQEGVCPAFTGVAWMFAVNKNASEEKKKIAKEFLDWMAISESGKKTIREMGYVLPYRTVKKDEIPQTPTAFYKYDMFEKQYEEYPDFGHTLMPVGSIRPNFFKQLNRYAKGEITWEEVCSMLRDNWVQSFQKNEADMKEYFSMLHPNT